MTVRLDDLLSGHPLETTLRAALLEHILGPRLHVLADVFGFDGERQRAALRQARRPRTALPLLGPWAPPLPSGGWILCLPDGRARFTWSDAPGHPGARRVTFGGGLATGEGVAAVVNSARGAS